MKFDARKSFTICHLGRKQWRDGQSLSVRLLGILANREGMQAKSSAAGKLLAFCDATSFRKGWMAESS
jgi:hypothetical protein